MGSYTVKTKCNNCGSYDCNHTITDGWFVAFKLTAKEIYCNSCGFYSIVLNVNDEKVVHTNNT